MTDSQFPAIALLWLFAAISMFTLGIRSLLKYRSLNSPISLYIGITGLIGGLFFIVYSVPFLLTDDTAVLKTALLVSTLIYYGIFVFQTRIIWYMTFKQRVPYWLLLTPAALVASVSFYVFSKSILGSNLQIVNANIEYTTPTLSRYLESILSLEFIWIGITFLLQLGVTKSVRAKMRLLSLGVLYLVGGATIIYSHLVLGDSGNSLLIYVAFAIVFGFVLASFLLSRSKSTGTKS